jgi:hypothetical protein
MQELFSQSYIEKDSLLICCSSHEDRCFGILLKIEDVRPKFILIFRYDDENPRREENHNKMIKICEAQKIKCLTIDFGESNTVLSFSKTIKQFKEIINKYSSTKIFFDISVFTKRHLLMLLRWLDDENYLRNTIICYTEPEDYEVSEFIPLSTGISSINPIPGYSSVPDLSRPLHLLMFLGFEGDRAIAAYEHLQPMQTTLIITETNHRETWSGKCEFLNSDLINLVGKKYIKKLNTHDPNVTRSILNDFLCNEKARSTHANIICPLGPKPQLIGIYNYLRECIDPPGIIYTSPSTHNHDFFSTGIGYSWILKN